MMPYIIILKVRTFHQSTKNCFGTAGKKPVGAHSLKRAKIFLWVSPESCIDRIKRICDISISSFTSNVFLYPSIMQKCYVDSNS